MNNGVQPDHLEPSGGIESVDELLERAQEVLRTAATLSGATHLATRDTLHEPRTAETALTQAERILANDLAHVEGYGRRAQLAGTVTQIVGLLSQLREARLLEQSVAMENVQQSLNRLRSGASLGDLLEQAPVEIHRLGYQRALCSLFSGRNWTARSAYAHADPQLAHALVEIGTAVPGRLGRELPETEVVRTRRPVLVEDAQHNPHVHHRLVTLSGTPDYVVAPLIARGLVVGLVHADRHTGRRVGGMDRFDQRLLGLFAEGLGCVFERAMFAEQLRRLQYRFSEEAETVGELLGGVGEFAAWEPAAPADPPAGVEGPLAELTRRELEVLRHLVRGETNSQIAATLFVTPGTVKTHVKNVLRKLGVANRAEAAARFRSLAH